jgi:acyl dehydratase
MEDLMRVDGMALMINYGLNKVRFPAPLPVGNRVRMRMHLTAVDDVAGGAQLTTLLTFERGGKREARMRGGVALARLHGLST